MLHLSWLCFAILVCQQHIIKNNQNSCILTSCRLPDNHVYSLSFSSFLCRILPILFTYWTMGPESITSMMEIVTPVLHWRSQIYRQNIRHSRVEVSCTVVRNADRSLLLFKYKHMQYLQNIGTINQTELEAAGLGIFLLWPSGHITHPFTPNWFKYKCLASLASWNV